MTKLTKEQIQNILTTAVQDAVSFIESEIAPDRIAAQKYFNGQSRIEYEPGRSKVVATKCRDVVRAVKPGILRLFMQSGNPVEFVPSRADAAQAAEHQTAYAKVVFERNGGFGLLAGAIHDALIKKTGILKPYYDETEDVRVDEYSGISLEQFLMIAADQENEVIESSQDETGAVSAKVSHKSKAGRIRIDAIAPEDFFIDRGAKSVKDAYVCGHSTEGRVGDLVAMGFDFDEVVALAGAKDGRNDDAEQFARTGWDEEGDENAIDQSMRKVTITEAYMRMDIEGTGVPKRYKFICAGSDYTFLHYELCDHEPFAVFEVDPEPHTFFGRSLVEIIQDDQDVSTALLRGMLDAVAMTNNPRLEVVKGRVVMDDLLNPEIGAIVQVDAPGMIREIVTGQGVMASTMPAMQWMDDQIKQKTGVLGAGMGLDADALQSQTAAGVRLADQTSNAAMELMARTLAEGGMKQLSRIICELARQNPNQDDMIRLNGEFIPVDPTSWNADLDMSCNVGLGTGRTEERIMSLNQLLQMQMSIWQAYGPQNGIVTMTGIRAAMADIARLGGVYNVDKYLNPMNPQIEQQLLAQAAQASQGQQASDPNAVFMQAEQIKAQARMQTDMAKLQLEQQKIVMEDDRARDKMAQDLTLEAAKIQGQHQIAVNQAAVKAMQGAPRV